MSFQSDIVRLGRVWWPEFTGIRIMMMPFRLDVLFATLPASLHEWRYLVRDILWTARKLVPAEGVAYLTIDEALVKAGETHRRPGIHVDGVGGWGGGGGYARNGMLTAASHIGARGWAQEFQGEPGPNGDCSKLREQCQFGAQVDFLGDHLFWCSPMAVHEALPMQLDTKRQFVRISMPSECPWYEGYTRNPLGVEPTGTILPPRTEFMSYRP